MASKSLSQNTADLLKEYLLDVLKRNKLNARFCAYSLEYTFGVEIHKQIDGFIAFATEPTNGLGADDIRATLCHDLGGALNQDTLMLPRVSEYSQFSKL